MSRGHSIGRLGLLIFLLATLATETGAVLASSRIHPLDHYQINSLNRQHLEARSTWIQVLQIVEGDKSELFEAIKNESDSLRIDSLLSVWLAVKDFENRPDTPNRNEWLDEMINRLDFSYSKFQQATWSDLSRDLRFRSVILNGIPAECENMDSDTETIVLMVFRNGVKIQMASDISGSKPWKLRPHPDDIPMTGGDRMAHANMNLQKHKPQIMGTTEFVELWPKVKHRLSPVFDLVSMHDDGNLYSVLVSYAVIAEQIENDSAGVAAVHHKSTIYRLGESGPVTVAADSSVVTFRVAQNDKRSLYPMYESYQLSPGNYTMILSLDDGGQGLGVLRSDFSIPSRLASKGISDILLLTALPEDNLGNVSNRLVRDNWAMKGNAYPVYYKGDEMHFYAEVDLADAGFKTDAQGNFNYRIYGNLLRQKKDPKASVRESEEFLVMPDSLDDNAMADFIRRRTKGSPDDENLIYSFSKVAQNAKFVINSSASIPDIKGGEYYFVLRIDDLLGPASAICAKSVRLK